MIRARSERQQIGLIGTLGPQASILVMTVFGVTNDRIGRTRLTSRLC
jgi:hypothetical protein